MSYHRSQQKNWVRLLKQIELAEQEFRCYGVKKIRHKSYHDGVIDLIYFDPRRRALQRGWKKHRKHQYRE